MRNLAIGDIHGCYYTFRKLLDKINLSTNDNLYLLGDMVNRGTNSSNVLDLIIDLQKDNHNIFPIRGNHEQLLLNLLNESPHIKHKYLRYYKSTDLFNSKDTLKKRYFKLLNDMPFYLMNDNSIFVHAALDLSREDVFENKDFMLYSRYQRGSIKNLNGKRLFHGHVATNIKIIRNNVAQKEAIIGIDNGCIYAQKRKGFGRLICINTDNLEVISVKNIE
ncbi:MAG: metallophosphoesterase family protein [Bacteroidales bacterium]|nr:metallophosphoesterase family protein [Bacteroidales bacterium]